MRRVAKIIFKTLGTIFGVTIGLLGVAAVVDRVDAVGFDVKYGFVIPIAVDTVGLAMLLIGLVSTGRWMIRALFR